MKIWQTVLFLAMMIVCSTSFADADVDLNKPMECTLTRFVSAPYFSIAPEVGSIAHVSGRSDGGRLRLITIQDLLNDEFIFFKNSKGVVSENYLWLYGRPQKIDGTSGSSKYYAYSVVGDVIITITNRGSTDTVKRNEVTYANTEDGFMLSLMCEEAK